MHPEFRYHPKRARELAALAWPAALSYILNNTYRINDQFWIKGLGDTAQAAVGATFFVQVLNFALIFLAVGGTLALVARATGAQDPDRRNSVIRNALLMSLLIGGALSALVIIFAPQITDVIGLDGQTAIDGQDYLGMLYRYMVPMAVFPVMDAIFIGLGKTRITMVLQGGAVALNYFLNPLLIYGSKAGELNDAWGSGAIGSLAASLGIDGFGIAGAAMATGIARTIIVSIGIYLLWGMMDAPLWLRGSWRKCRTQMGAIMRISGPSAASIAFYALAYLALIRLVLTSLGDAALAGLGIGFQVFEGLSFPCYLGLAVAGSSLVGREIGARNEAGVIEVVGSARALGRILGIIFALLFWFVGPHLVQFFTTDPEVARETINYVRILAFSQYWVAVEAVNEKTLLGSGQTRPIMWISMLGNLLRLPLGWICASGTLGIMPSAMAGAAGVWWSINLTTMLKAYLFWGRVQSGNWLRNALSEEMQRDVEV